jgi:lipopolysaccharide/colanic/teichoic acid biosynthesis glycosyltransferase
MPIKIQPTTKQITKFNYKAGKKATDNYNLAQAKINLQKKVKNIIKAIILLCITSIIILTIIIISQTTDKPEISAIQETITTKK